MEFIVNISVEMETTLTIFYYSALLMSGIIDQLLFIFWSLVSAHTQ